MASSTSSSQAGELPPGAAPISSAHSIQGCDMSQRTASPQQGAGRRAQRALVLGGGGLLGAMFQIGVLAALEKEDPGQADFDLVVGTSGGAVVAALLAAGFQPGELRRIAPAFAPTDLSRVCWRSLVSWLARSPSHVFARLRQQRRHGGFLVHDLTAAMLEAAPSGLLSLEPLAAFIARTLDERGIPDRFDALPRALMVPAIDLDWGERVVFGAGGLRSASVSSAVAASCAIPRLFRPVTIGDRDLVDGGIADLLNLDLALRPGIRQVLAIQAVVAPINDQNRRCLPSPAGDRCGRIAEQGFGAVMRQASKIGHMLVTHALIDLQGSTRRGAIIEIVQPDRLQVDLDGLMDFRAAARLLIDGERAARKFLASRPAAETA
jgi:NTE family protein